MVSPTQLKNALGDSRTRTAVMIGRQKNGRAGSQWLEGPDRVIGLAVVERDRNRTVQPGPGDILLPDREQLERGPEDHDAQIRRATAASPARWAIDDWSAASLTAVAFLIANSGSGAGRQTCRNSSVAISEPSEDSTSVSV